jgi:lipoyl(octanoyl) transferase
MLDTSRELWVLRLDRVPYTDALALQRAAARARIRGAVPQDLLILLEHPPVVTLGRTAKTQHLVAAPDFLAARGVEVHEVERGGDVTFHGPGQLVGYPIVDLKRHKQDLHWYLRRVEEALIQTIGSAGIAGERSDGYTGVWTRGVRGAAPHAPRKIASIGVHARDWVTWHGFALNVVTDLAWFDLIVPCGIAGVDMTSMAREVGSTVALSDVEQAAARAFGEVFDLAPREVALDALALSDGVAA